MRKDLYKNKETIFILFAAGGKKFGFPNFFPVQIGKDEKKLKRLAKKLPTYYGAEDDPETISYQLFEFPLNTFLAGYTGTPKDGEWMRYNLGKKGHEGLVDPEFASMLGYWRHEHLNEYAEGE